MLTFSVRLPFAFRQHSDMPRIEQHTLFWAEQFGVADSASLTTARFGTYAALTCPSASTEGANLMADLLTWLFVIDDRYETATELTADPPLIAALIDISTRLGKTTSADWRARFTTHFTAMMAAAEEEMRLRDTGSPPQFDDYVTLRREAGAMKVVFTALEACLDTELPSDIHQSATYQEIVSAGADVVTWTNDLYSAEKEQAAGMVTNVVLVQGGDLASAITATLALVHHRARDLQDTVTSFCTNMSPADPAHRWAHAVLDWVAGSNHWHTTSTARYR